MFASLCLSTKNLFPIGHVPRVKRRTKITNHIALDQVRVPWNHGKSMCQSRQAANSFIYLFFSAVIAKNDYVLLYRHECFTGKYTTRNIHKKLHPGPEWFIFHNLTREFIDDVISVISLYYFIDVFLSAFVRKILFCHSKIKFISSRHRVISSI